jgi:hypothetical protein
MSGIVGQNLGRGSGLVKAGGIANDAIDSEHYVDASIDLAHMSSESVDEDNLHISNSGSNGQALTKQSGNAGGLTWASAGGGILISTGFLSTGTRSVLSNGSGEQTIWTTGNFDKTTAGTDLFIVVQLAHNSSGAGASELWIKYGSGSSNYNLGLFNYTGTYGGQTNIVGSITGHTTTGAQAFTIGWNMDNGASDRPFVTFNPNSTEDARYGQTYSTMLIWEIDNS